MRAIRQTEKAEKRQEYAADLAEASRLRLGKRVVGIAGGYSEARSYQRGNDATMHGVEETQTGNDNEWCGENQERRRLDW